MKMEKNSMKNINYENIQEGLIMNANSPTKIMYISSYSGFYKDKFVAVWGNVNKLDEIKKRFFEEMRNIGYVLNDKKKIELTRDEIDIIKNSKVKNNQILSKKN